MDGNGSEFNRQRADKQGELIIQEGNRYSYIVLLPIYTPNRLDLVKMQTHVWRTDAFEIL